MVIKFGRQRMADAGSHRKALDVSQGVSRSDAQGRRAVYPGRASAKILVFLWYNHIFRSGFFAPAFFPVPSARKANPTRPSCKPCLGQIIFFLLGVRRLALYQRNLETFLLIVGPVIGIGFLIALPLIVWHG